MNEQAERLIEAMDRLTNEVNDLVLVVQFLTPFLVDMAGDGGDKDHE